MLKIETHTHIKGGSPCGLCSPQELIRNYKRAGYDCLVSTGHYSKEIVENYYSAKSDKEGVDKFLALYDAVKLEGLKNGLKVFLGIEVCLEKAESEYIILGFNRKFLYENPKLYDLTQKELYDLCQKNDYFMYQTHPFRKGLLVGDPKYMHGAESFNGYYHHLNNNQDAKKFCEDNNLIMMAGTDFHHPNQPITSAMFISEDVQTEKQLSDYFKSGKSKREENDKLYKRAYAETRGVK